MNCVLFAKMDQGFSKENKTLKKYLKIGKKYWKSQGILSVRKSGNPVLEMIGDTYFYRWWYQLACNFKLLDILSIKNV